MAGFLWPPLIERLLRRTSHRIVFDYDAIYYEPRAEKSFREIITFSDQIIAGNKHLANITNFPSKTTMIPTSIDTDRFAPVSMRTTFQTRTLIIGWTGTVSNYQYLYPLAHVLAKVVDRCPHTILKIICDKPPDLRLLPGLKVQFVRWQAENEVEQLRDIDIGIMYLLDSPWARGKCGFKLIQYMSMAKPVVASPVGANFDIVNHGVNGYFASTMDDWYNYLTYLLDDTDLRITLGHQARQTIEAEFSVSVCFPKLHTVFLRALA
jgi:glycosyltransferase involved in cell wall biosynthesis